MLMQQAWALKSRFGRHVLDDDWAARRQRVAGLRTSHRGNMGAPDEPRLPTYARAQQHLGIARRQFENLDKLDVQHRRDHERGLVEEGLEISLHQRALAKPCDGLLLARAPLQLPVQLHPVGNIPAGPGHAGRFAILHDDAGARFDPALVAVAARWQSIEQAG
jgi:hypothetical protein